MEGGSTICVETPTCIVIQVTVIKKLQLSKKAEEYIQLKLSQYVSFTACVLGDGLKFGCKHIWMYTERCKITYIRRNMLTEIY